MKIINVTFNNLTVFKDGKVSIDLFATDRVVDKNNNYHIANSIYIQNSIAFVGINATGKTTLLRLLNAVFSITIKNYGLNEVQNNFIQDGTIMSVIFFHKDKYYKLESIIGCETSSDISVNKRLYYKEEVLFEKNKSSVKTKKDLFVFTEDHVIKRRSKLDDNAKNILKEDDSIVIIITRDVKLPIIEDIEHTNMNLLGTIGTIPSEVLNVFDENIEYLESSEQEKPFSWKLKFKNSEDILHIDKAINVGRILSSGTIKGQRTILCAVLALRTGGYLIIDELENHFNKELVRMILNLFNDKETNPHGACLIFSTHYSEILDFIERKDNIFIARKSNGIIEVFKYSDKVTRNDIKKSETIISNSLKGTAPQYENIMNLRKSICRKI